MELANSIEAILFYQAEPMKVSRLAALLKRSEPEVLEAIKVLEDKLQATGLRLLTNGGEVTLGTSPDASALIEAITKEELSKDLSKASLETLAIVLYKGPLTRAEIDYVRGVNSTFILRNLLIRGLVEKVDNPNDQRSFLYKPTFQLLEHMGVTKAEELPAYHDTLNTLAGFVALKEEEKPSEDETEIINTEINTGDTAMTLLAEEEQANEAEVLEADISEEDQAVGNFDDEALQEHREDDKIVL